MELLHASLPRRFEVSAERASAHSRPTLDWVTNATDGALLCIYNVTRTPQTNLVLELDWDQIKSPEALEVIDAYTQNAQMVNGTSLALDVPALNYRLLSVR
jgi:hypothetical protein